MRSLENEKYFMLLDERNNIKFVNRKGTEDWIIFNFDKLDRLVSYVDNRGSRANITYCKYGPKTVKFIGKLFTPVKKMLKDFRTNGYWADKNLMANREWNNLVEINYDADTLWGFDSSNNHYAGKCEITKYFYDDTGYLSEYRTSRGVHIVYLNKIDEDFIERTHVNKSNPRKVTIDTHVKEIIHINHHDGSVFTDIKEGLHSIYYYNDMNVALNVLCGLYDVKEINSVMKLDGACIRTKTFKFSNGLLETVNRSSTYTIQAI